MNLKISSSRVYFLFTSIEQFQFTRQQINADNFMSKSLSFAITILYLLSLCISQTIVVNIGCKSYAPDGKTCLKCSDRFYSDSTGVCQPVSSACKTYNDTNGACSSCYDGYFLVQTICAFGSLPSTDPYCISNKDGVCSKCSRGFYLLNNTCNMVDPLCKTFDYTAILCKQCYSGFGLNNGNCQLQAAAASVEGCAQFNGSICSKCSKGYYFNDKNICLLADVLCKQFDSNNGNCLSCYAGFKLENGRCIVDDSASVNPYCQKFENGVCSACSKGYYFDDKGICQMVDPVCKIFDYQKKICIGCYLGFTLDSTNNCQLSQDSTRDSNCKSFDSNGVCQNCSFGYYFNKNNVCTQIDPSCRNFDLVNLVCKACYDGYKIESGICIKADAQSDTEFNCAQWLEGVCIKCAARAYYNFQGNCVRASDVCQTFNNFNGECTGCYQGFSLVNGTCIESADSSQCAKRDANTGLCTRCFNGSYLSPSSTCILLDPHCQTFNYATYKCDNCYKGYGQNAVGLCEQNTIDNRNIANCVEYNLDNTCVKCFNLYYLSNNSCIQVNPLCKTYDHNNGRCLSCFSVFKLSDGSCIL